MRDKVTTARRWVIKIGSALLTADGRGLDRESMAVWVRQMVALRNSGVDVVLVSSGSIAAGMTRLGWKERPTSIHQLQAAAAVGQMDLVHAWEGSFEEHGFTTAQVLLTHDDLSDRKRYLNARSTLRSLLDLGVIPVINENDTVVTDEIRFGDNDTLGALVTNLDEADLLVILTDKDGLYTADPGRDPNAELIADAMADDPRLDAMAGGSAGALGRGGMQTKLRAARLAARSGASTVIVGGRIEQVINRLKAGEQVGTLLLPEKGMLAARKQWLAGHLQTRGRLLIDDGAVRALRSCSSLLPVGVKAVEGNFRRGEMVVCAALDGTEIARGLVNYGSQEASKILGQPSESIASILGYVDERELVHRDNMVLV